MNEDVLNSTIAKMDKAIDSLKKDFATVQTGGANTMILNNVYVDYYGKPTPIDQTSNVSITDAPSIIITPWEKATLSLIEKAISKSNIGITPVNNGKTICLPIPPLSEERRKNLVKQVKKIGENVKVSIRNSRRESNDIIKKQEKDKEVSKTEIQKLRDDIQKETDKHIDMVNDLIKKKEKN